jgi:eukaryotic-like serine/threonine-protein kinase
MNPGDVVADRFEIDRLAGAGGMGAVYRARDRMTGELVALKTLRTEAGDVNRRFLREARVLFELRHPAIVRYIAHGTTPKNELYLAMEWLEGQDLHARLRTRGLTLGETVTLVARVADGLGAGHARGIVHRDVKPGNLFLVGDDASKVKILDFGIAHQANATRMATRTGAMLGTPGYMSPEQARGERVIDARADVFSLGCVAFKCLVGRAPFAGEDLLAVAAKLLFEEPPRVRDVRPEVPLVLSELVARMLSKNAAGRPDDGAAVAAELDKQDTLVSRDAELDPPTSRGAHVAMITEAEQRLVCVVLAAASEETRDPEAKTRDDEQVTATWRRLSQAISPFGARLERLAGGSVVVTLAGKSSATDQAAQAARCALVVRSLLPDGPIALATGRGVLAGRLPYGEVIDRAVELLRTKGAAAAAGAPLILLDDVTRALLDTRFDTDSLQGAAGGPAEGSRPAYVLRGERDALDTTRTLLGRPTPCIGRERELGMLEVALNECTAEPIARAVVITGAPGVGKSRLLHEFLRRVHMSGSSTRVWSSRGDPMSAGSPFGMLAQALRRAIGVRDGEPAAVRREKLRVRVARSLPPEAAGRVTAFIAELIGAPLPDDADVQLRAARANPVLMGDQMQRAWEDFVAAECERGALVLVLEDLHWGDLPTVRFVDAALRNLRESPLFVLALARPELSSLFPSLWVERSPTELRLGELSRKASERLVREVLGERVESATVARLVERAAGNAFYLEELIRVAAEGKADALPETVLAMVQARLEELQPAARRVLRAASVFGQAFWASGVTMLLGGDEETSDVDDWLRLLAERELIVRRGEGKFPGEVEFTFRHALLRDAAYASLTEEDRALGHQLAGVFLEGAGESDALVLAEHFERGGEQARAVLGYLRAAEQALEGNDFGAVLHRVERGIACGAAGEALGRLWLRHAEARSWRGDAAEAQAAAEEALRVLPEASWLWFRAASQLANATGHAGNHARLVELAEALLAIAADGSSAEAIAPMCLAALQLVYAARYELADALLTEAERISRRIDRDPAVAFLLARARGARAAIDGDPAESLRLHRLAASAGEEAGDMRHACLERVNVGSGLTELGAHEEAAVELHEGLHAAQRMNLIFVVALAKHNLGWALARRGALAEGIAVEREAVDMFARQNNPRMESASRAYLSYMLTRAGDPEQAAEEAEVALAIVSSVIDRVYALGARANARLALGASAEALDDARGAVEMLDELGGIDEGEALIRLIYAEALEAAGRRAEAREAIDRARARLLTLVGKIGDPAARDRCLARVPENARILELARAWLEA